MNRPESQISVPPFAIFRGRDAVDYAEEGPMHVQPMSAVEVAGSQAMTEAGFLDGARVKLLYERPGMSLTYCWFKSGYPLPRHSHDADCLYFIVAGSLKLGSEVLNAGDGFFLGADVPYAYVPGEQGVEVLEFRTSDRYDFKLLANNPAYWQTAMAHLLAAKGPWPEERPPSGLEIG